jgi:predicted SnoaL-like aldol condensation-catalyzing enzyme
MDQVNITNLDETEANKALAVSIIEDVLMGQNPNNITNYIAEDYIQHNPGIDNGLARYSGSCRLSKLP